MLKEKLHKLHIILGSSSPRRQDFLRQMGFSFELRTTAVDEIYPPELKGHEISDYLACLKANALKNTLKPNEVLITSDTVVWHQNKALGKPADKDEAIRMLQVLSNDIHEVISSVCFSSTDQQRTVNHKTKVRFGPLSREEIIYYVEHYKPYDKAGGYGIQEWIGLIGIEEIQGSYSNVVGLPTHLVYKTLIDMVG